MVPTLLHTIGDWLDNFADILNRWEEILRQVELSYLNGDSARMVEVCQIGEGIHEEIAAAKRDRTEILEQARGMGIEVRQLKELANYFEGQWPALWNIRIHQLELQLNRIQTLSMSLWVSSFQSKSAVSEMLSILATGRSGNSTYDPTESAAIEGGFLVNEAA